ncbi:hypothetical protein BJ944DRAFT_159010 [Cunninghamella echinulata]|nr:hypothetical protein BJ944DRAFT_159010 [Cunninghamella echinulata]
MVAGNYHKVGTNNELNSLLFKYKLAKALTLLSLLAVIIMALASLVFPENIYSKAETDTENDPKIYGGIKTETTCQLPSKLWISKSEDNSYTPPHPHASVLKAVELLQKEDYNTYCQHWDPIKGFDDVIPYNSLGDCGNWQKKYIELHQKRLEQLERIKAGDFESLVHEDRPLYVSYLCKEVVTNRGCGGLADRMSAYLAHWADENPIPLEILFEQPNIQWSYDPKEMTSIFRSNDNDYLGLEKVDTLNKKYDDLGDVIFPNGPTQDFNDLWNASYVEVRSNRAYIIRTFDYSTKYPKELQKIGLTKENAFGCLADFLFRPTIGSRRFINFYRELFSLKSVLSIGIQIRTDDNALANPQYDSNTLEKWYYFFKCANELALSKKEKHHERIVYFLVTDSHKLREEFESMNEDFNLRQKYLGPSAGNQTSLVITGLPLEHIEPDQVAKYIDVENPIEVNRARMVPGVNSAVIENWLLSYTDYRVISPQGYGKLAAFHSRADFTTISLPRVTRAKAINCANPQAMTSYDWLSHQWSLG